MTTQSEVADTYAVNARFQRPWYWYDWANSAFVTTTGTVLFGPYLTSVADAAACPGLPSDQTCATNLHLLGIPIDPGSLAPYTVTVRDHPVGGPAHLRRRGGRPVASSGAPARGVRLARRRRGQPDVLRGGQPLAPRRPAHGARDDPPRRVPRRLRLDPVPDRASRRPGPGVVERLGPRLPRRRAPARRSTSSSCPSRASSASTRRWRCGSASLSAGLWWGLFTLIPVIGMWRLRGVEKPVAAREAGAVGGSWRQLASTFAAPCGPFRRPCLPPRLPVLQRRHPDRHQPVEPLRSGAAEVLRVPADGAHPARPVRRLRGCPAVRPVRRPLRRLADGPRLPRRLDGHRRPRVLPARRAVPPLRRRSASPSASCSAAARR